MDGTRDLCCIGAVALFWLERVDITRDNVSDCLWSKLVFVIDIPEPEPVLLPVNADDNALATNLVVRVETVLLTDAATSELHVVARHDVPERYAVLGLNKFGLVCSVGGSPDGEFGTLGRRIEMTQRAHHAAC